MGETSTVRRNLAMQREYYGEHLGDRVRRLVVYYDVSQAHLAGVIGISPPMLSQVMSGRRQKIANPAVLAKLVLLERKAAERAASGSTQARLAVLAEVRAVGAADALLIASAPDRGTVVQGLRAEFDRAELVACAQRVREVSPDLARLLDRAAR